MEASRTVPAFGRVVGLALTALLLFLLVTAGPANAQQVRRITFNEAVQIALEQNVSLKKAANRLEQSAIALSNERMAFYPDLSFSSNGSQNYGRNFIMHEGRIVNTTVETFNIGANANVNLFNGFADVASLKAAQLDLEASDLDLERARQTVVFNVMENYLTLISRREQIAVQEENLAAQRQQLERIQAFTEVGSRPISDLYQQQAEVANAELQLVNAQRAFQLAEVNLIQTLQLDPFAQYEFVAPSVDEIETSPRRYEMEQLLRQAFSQRADLKSVQSSIEAARQSIRAARSTYWPRINLRANYGTNYSTALEGFDLWEQFNQARGGSVGLSLTLPIFDRFATRNAVQQARVQFDNARLDLEDVQQSIAVQVRQAYLDYLLAEKTLEVTDTQLRSAELALEAATERYNVQAATLVEVTQARAAYVRAVTDRVNARYDFLFRAKLIDYYLGSLDPSEPLFE
jgi:outer membrane protein